MNKRAKGLRAEKNYELYLRNKGIKYIYRVKGSTIWQPNQDIFGMFDILYIDPATLKDVYVQVKSTKDRHDNFQPVRKAVAEFAEETGHWCRLAVWRNGAKKWEETDYGLPND